MEHAHDIALQVLEGNLSGRAVAHDGELLAVVLPKAFPPGKPLELALALPDGSLPLTCRCIGSKLRADGQFDVRLRLTNLRREARDKLRAAFARIEDPSVQ